MASVDNWQLIHPKSSGLLLETGPLLGAHIGYIMFRISKVRSYINSKSK